ncbi:hypothetical protein [Nostoc sp. TCL26-01]|uniref:hypothetical protein n=1 Tax=Nostoc sp. TCL26-01 TaxID=2576904 RepID=UPI0015BD4E6C|nr:hypothetical protein [Nostoc sp. TCL26-01]QLE58200.1 hypothetical protein FD725_23395 [Nostoc sp. TCL26-01]
MKVKLLNFLTVCLVTLAVLSPGLAVFSVVWIKHIEFAKTQKLNNEVNNISQANTITSTTNPPQNLPPHLVSTQFSDQNAVNQLLSAEYYRLATILQWFILLTPIFIGLGIIIYDRYLVYRATVLKEQIEMLERLWRQSIEQ